MSFSLRPYQQEAVDATLAHFRKHLEPAVIVLPTGAGKSLVIAELARVARGRVLVLAHVKELVAQNHAKYCALGLEADIFAAGGMMMALNFSFDTLFFVIAIPAAISAVMLTLLTVVVRLSISVPDDLPRASVVNE